ncbi:hypothetical protein [Nostoc sp.]
MKPGSYVADCRLNSNYIQKEQRSLEYCYVILHHLAKKASCLFYQR